MIFVMKKNCALRSMRCLIKTFLKCSHCVVIAAIFVVLLTSCKTTSSKSPTSIPKPPTSPSQSSSKPPSKPLSQPQSPPISASSSQSSPSQPEQSESNQQQSEQDSQQDDAQQNRSQQGSASTRTTQTTGKRAEQLEGLFDRSFDDIDRTLERERAAIESSSDGEANTASDSTAANQQDQNLGKSEQEGEQGAVGDSQQARSSTTVATDGGQQSTTTVQSQNSGASSGSTGVAVNNSDRIPDDIGSGIKDDIIARQLREAAINEDDPEVREKLWEEYRRYTGKL